MGGHYTALKKQEQLEKYFRSRGIPLPPKSDMWPKYQGLFVRRPPEHDAGDEAVPEREAVVGCWAHARRKFHDLYVRKRTAVNTAALARIAELFAIEAEIRGQPADIRRMVRQARAGPLLRDLQTWFKTTLATVSVHSDTARAINYALNQWQALTRYVDDGTLEAENNAAERALRAVALGRKNYLHFGSDRGGELLPWAVADQLHST